MMLMHIAIISLFIYIIIILWKRRHSYRLHHHLKNETWSFPILGNYWHFLGDDEDRMKALQRFGRIAIKQGGMTSLWIGPKYFVMVADAEVAELVLKKCLDKDENMHIARELLGNGTITAPVEIWRTRRKAVAPTFSIRNLNRFVEIFSRQSNIMAGQLKKSAGKGTFSVWKYLTTYTMDSVCESTLGVKVDAQHNPDHPFLEAFDRHCQMGSFRLLLPPLAQKAYTYLPIFKQYMKDIHCMHDFVDAIIRKRRVSKFYNILTENVHNIHESQSLRPFLELFMESGGSSVFTDIELREETLVLILAGTDTSAVGAAFTCLMLAMHEEVQERVYEEIQEVFKDSKEPVTAADLPRLKYLEVVVKETLRLYPPVPIITRRVDQDFQLSSGLTIPKDTSMLINIWAIHRNSQYWGEDAEQFRPERFLEGPPKHPAAFIPFSHGPRSCLGYQYAMMSMKTAVVTMLRHYRVLPATRPAQHNALRVKYDIMMKHVHNFTLQLELRNQ